MTLSRLHCDVSDVRDVLERQPCQVADCSGSAWVAYVCDAHCAELDAKLGELESLFARLSAMPVAPIEQVPQKPSFESKSPANDHVIALRDPRTLNGPVWCMQQWQKAFWVRKVGLNITPSRSEADLCAGMTLHWPYWAHTNYAGRFFEDMSEIWAKIASAVGEYVENRPIGVCACGKLLFWRKFVSCDSCGAKYENLTEIAIRKAVLTYQLLNAPYWKSLVRQSRQSHTRME